MSALLRPALTHTGSCGSLTKVSLSNQASEAERGIHTKPVDRQAEISDLLKKKHSYTSFRNKTLKWAFQTKLQFNY